MKPPLALLLVAMAAAACSAPPEVMPPSSFAPPGVEPGNPAESAGPLEPVLDLSAHSFPEPPADVRGRVPEAGEADPVLAEVDGRPIRAGEVARFLFRFDPERALDALNQILDARILEEEAVARSLTLPPGEIEARTEARLRTQERELRIQYGPDLGLERYLGDRFGISMEVYREDVAALVRLQALRDRLVRLQALEEDRIRIRVLVVKDEEAAREAARRLREGADFTSLARQVSLVPPEDLPSYRREDIRPPELAAELFALGSGGVSRPVRVAEGDREVYEVFKVLEVRTGRPATWAEAAEGVEQGLRDRPVTPAEYLQWAGRARKRHGVRVHLEEPGVETGGGDDAGGKGGR